MGVSADTTYEQSLEPHGAWALHTALRGALAKMLSIFSNSQFNLNWPEKERDPLLGIYLREMKTYIHLKTSTQMFTATRISHQTRNKGSSMSRQMVHPVHGTLLSKRKKLWHMLGYEQISEALYWMKEAGVGRLYKCLSPLIWHCENGRTIGMENRSVIASGQMSGSQFNYKERAWRDLGGWWSCSVSWLWWWLHEYIYIYIYSEVYTHTLYKGSIFTVCKFKK